MRLRTRPALLPLVHVAVIAILTTTTLAQITTTGIRGIVRDPYGAVVPIECPSKYSAVAVC